MLIVPLQGIGQQVNPFELRKGKNNEQSVNVENESNDTSNFNIKVIEDTLQKPVINTSDEFLEDPSLSSELISEEEEVKEESSVVINPFSLINDTIAIQEVDVDTVESIAELDTTTSFDTLALKENISPPIEKVEPKIPLPKGGNLIVLWLSLLCGLLIAISINSKRNILSDLSKSIRNLNYMKSVQKEQKNGWSISYILFYLVFLLNITIFVRFLCVHFELPLLQYSYVFIGLFILSLIVLRHLSLYVISFMRKRLNEPLQYNFIIISSHILTGLVLLPINLFIAFSSPKIAIFMLYLGIVILVIAYLSRWFRAFLNSLRIILGHSFHFLLYLCSCEIVPILILIGYLRNLIS